MDASNGVGVVKSLMPWLCAPQLRLEKVVGENEPEWVDQHSEWYWHLRVKNDFLSWLRWLRWLRVSPRPATNCRVRLWRFERLDTDSNWDDDSSALPLQYCWPFSAATDLSAIAADPARGARKILSYEMIDFGVLKGTSGGEQTRFKPLLYDASGYAERASVTPGQTVRYHLEVISDQFTSRICQVFKVNYSSDGWTDDKNEIRKRLKITEVTDTAKEESSNGATR